MQVQLPGTTTPIKDLSGDAFSFIACSGARSTGVTPQSVNAGTQVNYYDSVNPQENAETNNIAPWNSSGYTDWGTIQNPPNGPYEGLQINSNTLGLGTQLVTISIGGNDARFVDVLIGCLTGALSLLGIGKTDCSATNWYLQRSSNSVTDPLPLYQFEPEVIQALTAHLVQTYLAINSIAPNADIIVAGYPQAFPANPTTSCDSGSSMGKLAMLTPSAQIMLNGFSVDLNAAVSNAVTQVRNDGVAINFVNPTAAFAGHAMCTSDPWFLPISVFDNAGSFHPTAPGATAYADLVNECLAGTIEC
jgi:hypothetical protein